MTDGNTVDYIKQNPKHIVTQVTENGKIYYVCSVCGRKSFRKTISYGKIYCDKHYKQLKKYGHPIDDNPRTIYDKNEYHIDGQTTYIDLYDKNCNKIAQTMIDTGDLAKVRYTKWKLSASGYVMNTPKFKGSNIHMSRVILDTDQFVDHINHNILDNRKSNLRIVTKSQNQMNADHKGVFKEKNNKFFAHIKVNQKGINLGEYTDEEEALFARWYAEKILFGQYRYKKDKPVILPSREAQITGYIDRKVQRL